MPDHRLPVYAVFVIDAVLLAYKLAMGIIVCPVFGIMCG